MLRITFVLMTFVTVVYGNCQLMNNNNQSEAILLKMTKWKVFGQRLDFSFLSLKVLFVCFSFHLDLLFITMKFNIPLGFAQHQRVKSTELSPLNNDKIKVYFISVISIKRISFKEVGDVCLLIFIDKLLFSRLDHVTISKW